MKVIEDIYRCNNHRTYKLIADSINADEILFVLTLSVRPLEKKFKVKIVFVIFFLNLN